MYPRQYTQHNNENEGVVVKVCHIHVCTGVQTTYVHVCNTSLLAHGWKTFRPFSMHQAGHIQMAKQCLSKNKVSTCTSAACLIGLQLPQLLSSTHAHMHACMHLHVYMTSTSVHVM